LIIAVETLLLREHNRLCDIIQSQFPVWDDETVYQFARHALSVKYQMIANLYQQAYFTEEMPRPHIGKYFHRHYSRSNFFRQMEFHYSANGTPKTRCK
jgi:hypothetical protein